MKKYLVEHSALIGRSKIDGGHLEPITLKFFSVVEGTDLETASGNVANYQDPGFKCSVESITEIDKNTAKSLLERLVLKDVIKQF